MDNLFNDPILIKTSYDLSRLYEYMSENHEMPAGLQLKWDSEYDITNKNDPRAFCYVREGDNTIYCSAAIEALLPEVRVGILIHEVFHMILDAFDGADAEVDVDAGVMEYFPEAGYKYDDTVYLSPWTHEMVSANEIEHVSAKFLETIYGNR